MYYRFLYLMVLSLGMCMASGSYSRAQISSPPAPGYWELKAQKQAYFDSLITARMALGDSGTMGIGLHGFHRWKMELEPYMGISGNIDTALKAKKLLTADAMTDPLYSGNCSENDWTEIGPTRLSKILMWQPGTGSWQNSFFPNSDANNQMNPTTVGVVHRLYKHPSDDQKLYATNEYGGGLFYTENGGTDWIYGGTDKIVNPQVLSFCVIPGLTNDLWFLGLKNGAIYRSADKGQNWIRFNGTTNAEIAAGIGNTDDLPMHYAVNNNPLYGIGLENLYYDAQAGRLLAASFGGIYYTEHMYLNPVNDLVQPQWHKLSFGTVAGIDFTHYHASDIELFEKNGILHYAALAFRQTDADSFRCYTLISANGGTSWYIPGGTTAGFHGSKWHSNKVAEKPNIVLHKTDPLYLYVCFRQGGNVINIMYYRHTFSSGGWENLSRATPQNGIDHSRHAIVPAPGPDDGTHYILNNIYLYKMNGSTELSARYINYSRKVHADLRDALWAANKLYIGTDGGVFVTDSSFQSFAPITEGINFTEVRGNIDVGQQYPYKVGAGFWHGALNEYELYGTSGEWHNYAPYIGDGSTFVYNFRNPLHAFGAGATQGFRYIYNGFHSPVELGNFTANSVLSSELEEKYVFHIKNKLHISANYGLNFTALNGLLGGYNFAGPTGTERYATLRVSPSDPNYLYIMDCPTAWAVRDDTGAVHTSRIIIYRDILSPTPSDYVEISLAPFSMIWETDMVIDPQDPMHFYLIFRGANEPGSDMYHKKVYEYRNGSFINRTHKIEGRSDFPWYVSVNSIDIDRETGTLYISTTFGVFYLDESKNEWKKFSCNLPRPTGRIRIGHCERKIYFGSESRGVWVKDLPAAGRTDDPELIDGHPLLITADRQIEHSSALYSDLIVKNNARLTIKGDVFIYGMQKIIVEPGSVLELDGGRLSSGCNDRQWYGIQLGGTSSQAQQINPATGHMPYHARLITKNNAIIEYANSAIENWTRGPGSYGRLGGMVSASNTLFRNNRNAAWFGPYTQMHGHTDHSTFTNCSFLLNEDMRSSSPAISMVSGHDISGTRFTGCSFEFVPGMLNTATPPSGIYAYNWGYKVLPRCTSMWVPCPATDTDPCEFTGLQFGINSMGSHNTFPFLADGALFRNCGTAIHADHVNQYRVLNNQVELSPNPSGGAPVIGIASQYGTGFRIENNLIYSSTPNSGSLATWGILNIQSGPGYNEVYRNTIKNMRMALPAWGNNFSTAQAQAGLKYRCNEMNDNHNDIYVLFPGSSIGQMQGSVQFVAPIIYNPAGNLFSWSPLDNSEGHIKNEGSYIINYIHQTQALSPGKNVEPTLISPNITKIDASMAWEEGFCPSMTDKPVAEEKSRFHAHKPAYNDLLYTYTQLLDGGDTPGLLQSLNWPQDVYALRGELLQQSPYLSMEVLYGLLYNTQLPAALKLEVFSANPHCARDAGFMEELASSSPPFPGYMLELLQGQADSSTLRDGLMAQMSLYMQEWSPAADAVLYALASDSTGLHTDSMLTWLQLKGDLSARIQEAGLYAMQRQYGQALDLLGSMLSDPLLSKEEAALKSRIDYISLLQTFALTGQEVWALDSAQQEQLLIFATAGNESGHAQARNTLEYFYGYTFGHYAEPGTEKISRPAKATVQVQKDETITLHVRLYPNPASDIIYLQFPWNQAPGPGTLVEVYSLQGQPLLQQPLQEGNTLQQLSIGHLPAGTYVYRIKNEKGITKNSTFIVK